MSSKHFSPGEDVEAWCTPCRRNLNHRVVALLGTNIQKVQCLTCGSEHKFYPQKEEGPKVKSVRVKESAKGHSKLKEGKDSAGKSAAKAESEWSTFMSEFDPDSFHVRTILLRLTPKRTTSIIRCLELAEFFISWALKR